ncbi:MAG: hypothetical protein MUC63_08400 [Planctomycetes bacterium]|jgi:YbbR domain-containing protein|nr:hypothetical protein [Planctomycetota bacterium]
MGKHLKKALAGVFVRNAPLKVIALALAVLVWYSIGREITDHVPLDLPFTVALEPQGELEILGQRKWTVRVSIRGPRSEIQRIKTTSWNIEGTYRLALAEFPPGRDEVMQAVPVTPERFNFPDNIQVTKIDPDKVTVQVGRTGEKRLRVVPVISGRPAEGYAVSSIPRAVPRTVLVRGPLLALRSLEEIRTRPVDIDGATGSLMQQRTGLVTRALTRAGTFDLTCAEEDVDVLVAIQEVPAEVTIPRVPVRIFLPPSFPSDRYTARPKEEVRSVTVRGPKTLLQTLQASHIVLVADVKPDVSEAWFEKSESVDRDAALKAWVTDLPREDAARLEVVPDRPDTTYILTRIKQ